MTDVETPDTQIDIEIVNAPRRDDPPPQPDPALPVVDPEPDQPERDDDPDNPLNRPEPQPE
jgi:hypothetical protein